jgi:hypothetical protein
MSSRQEEKERRRREREELERRAQQASARRKRLTLVGVVVAAVAAVAVIGFVVVGGGDGSDGGGDGDGPKDAAGEVAKAPTQDVGNLEVAAEAAGCKVTRHRETGSEHTPEPVEYQTNPPTSGDHDPTPSQTGEYEADNPPDVEQSVHALEHGRILLQYKPGSPPDRIAQLRGRRNEEVKGSKGYKTLLFQNQTGMTHAVAATAWTRSVTCPEWNDQVFDALRAFREDFVDKGPEFLAED